MACNAWPTAPSQYMHMKSVVSQTLYVLGCCCCCLAGMRGCTCRSDCAQFSICMRECKKTNTVHSRLMLMLPGRRGPTLRAYMLPKELPTHVQARNGELALLRGMYAVGYATHYWCRHKSRSCKGLGDWQKALSCCPGCIAITHAKGYRAAWRWCLNGHR